MLSQRPSLVCLPSSPHPATPLPAPPPSLSIPPSLPPCPRSGDHTVKVTDCGSGQLARVLSGHRRTPWVVRFQPRAAPPLLASGSLDHEVRLWDASTGQCVARLRLVRLWAWGGGLGAENGKAQGLGEG